VDRRELEAVSDRDAKTIAVHQPVIDGTVVKTVRDPPPEVATVAATLRTVAGWLPDDDRDMLYKAAERTERDWNGACCPVCEEVTCDDGCPLEKVRATTAADVTTTIGRADLTCGYSCRTLRCS
jgi:hypothetical protein